MSMIQSDLLLGQEGGAGYVVERSLRFSSIDSAYLSKALTSSRTTATFAAWVKRSALNASASYTIFGWSDGTSNSVGLRFNNDRLEIFNYASGSFNAQKLSTAVYRDTSAWYHIVGTFDTTNATAADRLRLYVNGERVTVFTTSVDPSSSLTLNLGNGNTHGIGAFGGGSLFDYFNGYLADVHFIDGQALDPSAFVAVSATTGQLIPKAYTGSFGTNGFWLKFSDNSAATATTLGKDYSGNNNNWTPNNLSVGGTVWSNYVSFPSGASGSDTKEKAFDGNLGTQATPAGTSTATFTPPTAIPVSSSLRIYIYSVNGVASDLVVNGSINAGTSSTGWVTVSGVSSLSSIAWKHTAGVSAIGIRAVEIDGTILVDNPPAGNDSLTDTPTSYGSDTGTGGEVRGNYCTLNPLDKNSNCTLSNGNLDFSTGTADYGLTRATFGMSSGKWYWEITPTAGAGSANFFGCGIAKANASLATYLGDTNSWSYFSGGSKYGNGSGATAYGAQYENNDVIGVAFDADNGTLTFYRNGTSQGQAFSGLTSGPYFPAVSDGGTSGSASGVTNFGQRPFAYQTAGTNRPAATYLALCDQNLAAPVVAKPNTVFDVKLYTGNSSTQTISGLGFSPDFVWIKPRSAAYDHIAYDTVRGTLKPLFPNLTNAESPNFTNSLTAFNSDGYTLGFEAQINQSGVTFASWCWDAGTSTVTNTQGSITSQVRANASAGFSIVTYTGNGTTNKTVGHGLNTKPGLILVKCRNTSDAWNVYHSALGANYWFNLNTTGAPYSGYNGGSWNNTEPTSSVFTVNLPSGYSTGFTNENGINYVAYVFSPVAGYSAMGSYVGNGSASDGPFQWCGFRPRWFMTKRTDAISDWDVFDTARDPYNAATNVLIPNVSGAESAAGGPFFDLNSNGFKVRTSNTFFNASGGTYIWVAFAESPFQYARAR